MANEENRGLDSTAIAESLISPENGNHFALILIGNLHEGGRIQLDFATRAGATIPPEFREICGRIAENVAIVLTAHAERGGGGARAQSTRCQMPASAVEGGTVCTLAFGHTGPHSFPTIGGGS